MQHVVSATGEFLLGLRTEQHDFLSEPKQFSEYTVVYIAEGEGVFHADFGSFPFTAPALLFSTPLQALKLQADSPAAIEVLQFHGDFYCIEYHRDEVACNGLLFNNIYIDPIIALTPADAVLIQQLFGNIKDELLQERASEIVLRAYLQLFLAKSTSIKLRVMDAEEPAMPKDELMERFRQLIDGNYLTLHKPNDYAELLAVSPGTLTKRCTKYFKKPPTHLITERLILEAKRQLHLTRKSIKEIAYALNFSDEFYFSRVFKKFTNVSPQAFRDKTGISIVADLDR